MAAPRLTFAKSATPLTALAIRTPVNTEAKLLMLTHAFETWEVLGVCLHTDSRNSRSRAAIERPARSSLNYGRFARRRF